jgi:hypothetical protein
MAGLIARLFGGRPQPGPAEPVQGTGGYTAGEGPAGQSGFPGSTAQTRVNLGKPPRAVKIAADTDTGFEQGLSAVPQVRQQSYRGDVPGARGRSPRATPVVATPQPVLTRQLQATPATQLGGPMMKTGPGNQVIGGSNPLSGAQAAGGHSQRDTTTPWPDANITIGGGTPGAQNVRNTIAQRYKYPAGVMHTYKSAPRADQAPVNPGGQATDGNVHPERVVQDVTVENRMQYPDGGGSTSWSVLREMPYGGRGNGARGAVLNGQRRYATGQETQFWNAGQGSYGVGRLRGDGSKTTVSFTQPAPWSANVYTTTASVGTADNPNQQPGQQPQAVYVSPAGRRASNRTGRTG